MSELVRTPLYPLYAELGAKTVDYGGWELPVQFSGIIAEHHAVREQAGLFDVSHMGEVEVTGTDALDYLQKLLVNDVTKLVDDKILYSPMCYPDGGTVDDLLVYKYADNHYLLVLNAANTAKDLAWLKEHLLGDVKLTDRSAETALIALQGPLAETILQQLTDYPLAEIGKYTFRRNVAVAGLTVLVSRTGYTGEDGFEIYHDNDSAPLLWQKLLAAGAEYGLIPCGLGARDTLRFEARLPLYGQELARDITPVEAGLGFFVSEDKGDFIGSEVLLKQKLNGPSRKIVGIEMLDRGIPRTGYPVYDATGRAIGHVTSGTSSPTLKKNIGLVLINSENAKIGNIVNVEIRDKQLRAEIVKTPFYKRDK
jgi:aminomethyltransferase